tara:strand:+ start:155 stop:292 length:138 start_codon:yes stop_codon:yes gene_type:complete
MKDGVIGLNNFIAEELKTLDRKIVLNSVILKWEIIKKEFKERIQF